jgi:hypothetical protein
VLLRVHFLSKNKFDYLQEFAEEALMINLYDAKEPYFSCIVPDSVTLKEINSLWTNFGIKTIT